VLVYYIVTTVNPSLKSTPSSLNLFLELFGDVGLLKLRVALEPLLSSLLDVDVKHGVQSTGVGTEGVRLRALFGGLGLLELLVALEPLFASLLDIDVKHGVQSTGVGLEDRRTCHL
jgi:hypothetical protein